MAANGNGEPSLRRLHIAFGVAGALLLAATVAVIVQDKARAPRAGIRQVVLPELPVNVHFAEAPRVDRCQTCHETIDNSDARYRAASNPGLDPALRSHPRLELFAGAQSPHPVARFGCTICHGGRAMSVAFDRAAHTPRDEQQAAEWRQRYGWRPLEQWDGPMLPLQYAEASCRKCHRGLDAIPGAAALNRGRELFRGKGCTNCHMGSARDPDFAWAGRVGPDLTRIGEKTTSWWVRTWLSSPWRFRPSTTMPRSFGLENRKGADGKPLTLALRGAAAERDAVEIEAIATYLFVTSKLREAIPPAGPAGDTAAGRALFASAGCIACHSTRERAVGDRFALGTFAPDLSRVGDKVSAGWLYGWLRAPRAYLAETKMPDLRLAEMEAANLTAFLMQTMRGGGQPAQPGTFPEEAFDVLLAEQGPGAPERKPAAAVQAVFDALPDKARVTKAFAAGERLIQHYGCFACHTIQGLADAPLPCPDLTGVADKGPDKFAFGRTLSDASLRHTTWDWLRMKVSRPRVFDVGKLDTLKPNERLRMPWFGYQGPGAERNPDGPSPAGLSAAEADALVTHLLSLTNERVRESIQHAAGPRETADDRGWRALRERNCAACHLPRVVGTAGALPVETLLQWEAEHRANLSDPVEPDAAVQGLRAVHPSLFGVGRQ